MSLFPIFKRKNLFVVEPESRIVFFLHQVWDKYFAWLVEPPVAYITKTNVTAKTRALGHNYTIQSIEPLVAQHSIHTDIVSQNTDEVKTNPVNDEMTQK